MAPKDLPSVPSPPQGAEVIAAGAVVVRKDNGGEVLLVHRPKYDDWAWPKGKQEPGEHITTTAVREVLEETGVETRLDRPLPRQVYAVSGGKTKTVHYWVGRVVGDPDVSAYPANDEIDEVAWFGFDKARGVLSYADDVALLDEVERDRKRTVALVVLRHGQAAKRATWGGPDEERPLAAAGREQAQALIPVLSAYGVTRVVSSDSARCVQTVAPYARDHVLSIEAVPGINEEDSTPVTVSTTAASLLASKENAVVCSHRPVLPDLLDAIGIAEEPLAAGELVVVHHRRDRVVATERYLVQ